MQTIVKEMGKIAIRQKVAIPAEIRLETTTNSRLLLNYCENVK